MGRGIRTINTVIVGGGQAGLAMSASLHDAGLDHVVLERGRIAERWRSERWDSLRLLTPNWMTRLPHAPAVRDPNGFMTKDQVVELFETYARAIGSPVREGVAVTRVNPSDGGFRVDTTSGAYQAANVVVATGHCGTPHRPAVTNDVPSAIHQIDAAAYRNPDALPAGAVLVVGAGASGLQIAAELRQAGREVTLAAGRHSRAVRRHRGLDIWWWLELIGALDDTVDDVDDIEASRRTPSLGLTGAGGGRDLDLGLLQDAGVRLAGRLTAVAGGTLRFADDLPRNVAAADQRLYRLLDRFDAMASRDGSEAFLPPPTRPLPVRVRRPVHALDLAGDGISSIVWCTGYGRSYPWLDVEGVLDDKGELIQRRGLTPVPGISVLGLRFQMDPGLALHRRRRRGRPLPGRAHRRPGGWLTRHRRRARSPTPRSGRPPRDVRTRRAS